MTRNILEGTDQTGVATFDYQASVDSTSANKGIYLGYGLTQIQALSGKIVVLFCLWSNDSLPPNARIS